MGRGKRIEDFGGKFARNDVRTNIIVSPKNLISLGSFVHIVRGRGRSHNHIAGRIIWSVQGRNQANVPIQAHVVY